jgi:hypothetical protein
MTDKFICATLKLAALALNYPHQCGIPIERIDTHSLRSGGANALALNGYSDREIQKMGRWRSATFKEYITDQLNCYAFGMSTNMKRRFNFVNIAGGVYHDVTPDIMFGNLTISPATSTPTYTSMNLSSEILFLLTHLFATSNDERFFGDLKIHCTTYRHTGQQTPFTQS